MELLNVSLGILDSLGLRRRYRQDLVIYDGRVPADPPR
jgi:hypothetical protein